MLLRVFGLSPLALVNDIGPVFTSKDSRMKSDPLMTTNPSQNNVEGSFRTGWRSFAKDCRYSSPDSTGRFEAPDVFVAVKPLR